MIHYVSKGEGRLVVVLHGATLDHRHMVETVEPLFVDRPGWRRVYVDLPGHGDSPAGDIRTQEALLDAMLDFVLRTFPDERFALIGESRGSYIAQGMAYRRPDLVDGLLLIVPGGPPLGDPDRLPETVTLLPNPDLRATLPEGDLPRFDRLVVQSAAVWDKTRRLKIPAAARADTALLQATAKRFAFPFALSGPAAVFDKPCLIVAGRQDAMSGYRDAMDLMEIYPRASLAVLDMAGHAAAWERPEAFSAMASDWLNRLGGG